MTRYKFITTRYLTKVLILHILLSIMLLSGCAGPRPSDKQKLLRQELKKWESFDSHGIAEISYMGLALRKMFFAAKNKDQFRLDILDGGLMGAGAKPLLSFYTGNYTSFASPMLPMLEMLSPNDMIPSNSFGLFAFSDSLMVKYGQSIIATYMLEIDGLKVSFLKDFRLDKVLDTKSNSELKAVYNNSSLSELEIRGPDDMSIRLIFDEIKYIEPEIVPLPKSTSTFQWDGSEMNLKQLIKDFLRNKR